MTFDATAEEVTALITARVIDWGERCGFACSREVESRYSRAVRRGARWHGYLDVVGRHPNGTVFAVEIDRGNKARSVAKLAAEAAAGAVAIRVRWSGTIPPAMPPGIGMVSLDGRVRRLPGQRKRYWRPSLAEHKAPPRHSAPPEGGAAQLSLFESQDNSRENPGR